jgi:hypothetical protein
LQKPKKEGYTLKSSEDVFESPEDKIKDIDKKIDDIFSESPMELRKTTDNFKFIEKVRKNPIKPGKYAVDVFGVEKVDLNSILMMNMWDRSILTTDAVSKLVLKMTLEQLKKYLPKKTKKGFEYWWLVILMAVGGLAILLMIVFLLPKLGNLKLF